MEFIFFILTKTTAENKIPIENEPNRMTGTILDIWSAMNASNSYSVAWNMIKQCIHGRMDSGVVCHE